MDDGVAVPSPALGDEPTLVDLASIEAAAAALPECVRDSPAVCWDGGAWLKLETLQPVGSFKIRGAYTKISRLSPADRAAGVVAYSSGNHGIAVARAARMCGTRATVVVSEDAPTQKVGTIAQEGAEVVRCAPGSEKRRLLAEAIAAQTGRILVPPYNDPDVIAGQGTIGIELVKHIPELASVVVPVGGGGLISGIAVAVKALNPAVKVVGVEPELAGDVRSSGPPRRSGRPSPTVCAHSRWARSTSPTSSGSSTRSSRYRTTTSSMRRHCSCIAAASSPNPPGLLP
jgi:threonine dehydratase